MTKQKKSTLIAAWALIFALTAFFGAFDFLVPAQVSVFENEAPVSALPVEYVPDDGNLAAAVAAADSPVHSTTTTAKLFGIIPVKKTEVKIVPKLMLCPGGQAFGVKMFTDGVMIVGITEVPSADGANSPAFSGGLRMKDLIIQMNGQQVHYVEQVADIIEKSAGAAIDILAKRGNVFFNAKITPLLGEDGKYKAGMWVRDSTAGIGTITFINPANNRFAGLGHGICDVDTGELIPLLTGTVLPATITGVNKGKNGAPGELRGSFGAYDYGTLEDNTQAGVCGTLTKLPETAHTALPIALSGDVKPGKATIFATVDGDKTESFEIEITKCSRAPGETRNLVLKVTDERLLERTGGIVQGMSGSPIIQDGKLIGAVTHVLVNDPTKGYGIFIENMLQNMPELLN